jgi:hypothetical protein
LVLQKFGHVQDLFRGLTVAVLVAQLLALTRVMLGNLICIHLILAGMITMREGDDSLIGGMVVLAVTIMIAVGSFIM